MSNMWITSAEVARLGVKRHTFYTWCRRHPGSIRQVRCRGKILYRSTDVNEWLVGHLNE